MTLNRLLITAVLLAIGAAGAALAAQTLMPMPWLLGALIAAALMAGTGQHGWLSGYSFPHPLRAGFITVIGVMIGAQVTPQLLGQIGALGYTLPAMALFIPLAHTGNYLIFRKYGGYDRATAFFSGTPGGLMESIALGEISRADIRILTLQQFLRIILVISLLPLGLSIYYGTPVGSASTVISGGPAVALWPNLPLVAVLAGVGFALARIVHLPAGQLIGPLVLTGAASAMGWVTLTVPPPLVEIAQVVVGVSLGMRFLGVTWALLRRSFGLALLSVLWMLILAAAIAEVLYLVTGIGFGALLISFAPGGVTEMSLVALSLAINPAFVSLHHTLRILMTVVALTLAARLLGFDKPPP